MNAVVLLACFNRTVRFGYHCTCCIGERCNLSCTVSWCNRLFFVKGATAMSFSQWRYGMFGFALPRRKSHASLVVIFVCHDVTAMLYFGGGVTALLSFGNGLIALWQCLTWRVVLTCEWWLSGCAVKLVYDNLFESCMAIFQAVPCWILLNDKCCDACSIDRCIFWVAYILQPRFVALMLSQKLFIATCRYAVLTG